MNNSYDLLLFKQSNSEADNLMTVGRASARGVSLRGVDCSEPRLLYLIKIGETFVVVACLRTHPLKFASTKNYIFVVG